MPRLIALALACLCVPTAAAAGPLEGKWVFRDADQGGHSRLGVVRASVLTVTGDRFELSGFLGLPKPLTGTLKPDAAATPPALDVATDRLELKDAGFPGAVPKDTLLGVYKQEGDALTVHLNFLATAPRPKDFKPQRMTLLLTLARAPAGFTEFPKEVAFKVSDAAGKPVEGATLATFAMPGNRGKLNDDGVFVPSEDKSPRPWMFSNPAKTDAAGIVRFVASEIGNTQIGVYDLTRNRVALPNVSPADIVGGAIGVTLTPGCKLRGTIACEALAKAGKPIGWTNVYLNKDGQRVAQWDSFDGKFEFVVPPGDYTLNAYGSDTHGRQVRVTVPAGAAEYVAPPIALEATALALLAGKPAPELVGVVGWKNSPVKLSDLKGKYVLLDFWGYWCGPCVHAMPTLIEVHEKYADKGVAVVGVHVDGGGDVKTVAQLDEKVADYRKTLWGGKDLPFPVALVPGDLEETEATRARGDSAKLYGITGYPTTVLIDREGKVVGQFPAHEFKLAAKYLDKLLEKK